MSGQRPQVPDSPPASRARRATLRPSARFDQPSRYKAAATEGGSHGHYLTILVGLVVGVAAKFIHPGRENLGIVMTALLGIGGSLVATFLGQAVGWYRPGEPASFICAVVGAIVLLFVYGRLRGQGAR